VTARRTFERCTTAAVATTTALLLAAALSFVVVTGASAATPSVTKTNTVVIKGYKFVPSKFTVKAGTTLVVKNRDGVPHDLAAKNGAFDTGDISGAASGKVTVEKPGTYKFFCTIHPYMTGTLKAT
jgi:plastocyanin